jgi:hypothetical protein
MNGLAGRIPQEVPGSTPVRSHFFLGPLRDRGLRRARDTPHLCADDGRSGLQCGAVVGGWLCTCHQPALNRCHDLQEIK